MIGRRSERDPESQLHHARLIRETRVLSRLSITRVGFYGCVRAVVLMVEEVEHLHHAVHRPAAAQPEATLEPDIHPMQRRSDEVVTRHDAARRALGVGSGAQAGTIPAAIGGCEALARAVKIQPAHLETVPGLPDSVENSAVPLVGGCQSILR